ncbi:probable glutathione S-transferase [Phoenix dactylifera]|uniref:Glutathione S-transferase n=1 Tax=Phoenix dactylifera TaxID=42345 RepID=A0A8B7C9E7_PHODC|nr:probable glutathione S-transferase [Phoenix dactylifera]
MSKKDEVVVLDFWVSPFAMRVKIALEEKGIKFEAREEDLLGNKSELLLQSNPIYKKVPVLLHNGKPLCESLVILNYVDETWPSPPLLPTSPYERSVAKFWADFVDKKIFEGGSKIWKSKGEALEVAKKEFEECLKLLEGALGEKEYFAGNGFGFVDIVLIPHISWFYGYEQFGGFKVEEQCPKLGAWMKRCLGRESVAKVLPDPAKVHEFICKLRKMHGIE